jgi:hypothetical protein
LILSLWKEPRYRACFNLFHTADANGSLFGQFVWKVRAASHLPACVKQWAGARARLHPAVDDVQIKAGVQRQEEPGDYGRIAHSVRWHAHTGWNEQVHRVPRQMFIPARHTAILLGGHDTAHPPQLSRGSISQACSSAPTPVDVARTAVARMPISPAGLARWRMHAPIMA